MRARIGKHPIHPMLIPFPIALWIFSLFCDVVYLLGSGGTFWADAAFYTMAGGIIGALIAAPFGLVDFLSLSNTNVRRIGKAHMIINITLVVLFAIDLWLRATGMPIGGWPIALSVVGIIFLAVSGWLGGEMVYVHGVAVEPTTGSEMKEKGIRMTK
jgi:uncharacterized membrane protein